MEWIESLPVRILLTDLLVILAAIFAWRGIRTISRNRRNSDDIEASLRLVQGIRGIVFTVAFLCLAAGIFFSYRPLLLFGVVFLAEEIIEIGAVLLALKWGKKQDLAMTHKKNRESQER